MGPQILAITTAALLAAGCATTPPPPVIPDRGVYGQVIEREWIDADTVRIVFEGGPRIPRDHIVNLAFLSALEAGQSRGWDHVSIVEHQDAPYTVERRDVPYTLPERTHTTAWMRGSATTGDARAFGHATTTTTPARETSFPIFTATVTMDFAPDGVEIGKYVDSMMRSYGWD